MFGFLRTYYSHSSSACQLCKSFNYPGKKYAGVADFHGFIIRTSRKNFKNKSHHNLFFSPLLTYVCLLMCFSLIDHTRPITARLPIPVAFFASRCWGMLSGIVKGISKLPHIRLILLYKIIELQGVPEKTLVCVQRPITQLQMQFSQRCFYIILDFLGSNESW